MPINAEVEAAVESHMQRSERAAAAETLIRGYGPELYSYLCARLSDRNDADDVFSMCCEDIWSGLDSFRGDAAWRTWAYAVARRAALRLTRKAQRRARVFQPDGSDIARRIAADVRNTTAIFRRTAIKDRFRQLREELPVEDQELLILRVDRDLDWREIATVLSAPEASNEVVMTKAAMLRKRFERIKEKIRVSAEKAGLLER